MVQIFRLRIRRIDGLTHREKPIRLQFVPNSTQIEYMDKSHPPTQRIGPTRAVRATPISYVKHIIDALRDGGVEPNNLLKTAQITPIELQAVEGMVTARQFETFSELAMRALDDEALGWFERRLPWGSYGLLARAAITAPNLATAIRRWCQHHRLLTNAVALALSPSPADMSTDKAIVTLDATAVHPNVREFCAVTLLRNLLGLSSWLIDSRIALQAVHFDFPRPTHASAYTVLFPCPVSFEAPKTALFFDASYLSLPIRRDTNALQSMLQRALPLTVRHYRKDRRMVQQVKQFLSEDTRTQTSAADVAAHLGVSSRSLFRQLKEEGESWQHLKHLAGMNRATQRLLASDLPVKRIAELSGFRNEKSFSRAFKSWAGVSPQAYRATHDLSHNQATRALGSTSKKRTA
jgi:AraC-like DNA-binding protein